MRETSSGGRELKPRDSVWQTVAADELIVFCVAGILQSPVMKSVRPRLSQD